MGFADYFHKGILILRLNPEAIREVYRDEEALIPAVAFFAIAGLAGGAGQFSLKGMLLGVVLMTLVSFVTVGLLHVLGRLFGATASFLELYRPIGTAAPVHWVMAIPLFGPFLGVLALLYSMVVTVRVVETAGELSRSRALMVVTLLFGLCLFLSLVLPAVVGSWLLLRAVFG